MKWDTRHTKKIENNIPKDTEKLDSMMTNILERSVGKHGMKIMYNTKYEPRLMNELEMAMVNKTRSSLKKNRLMLENIMVSFHIYSMNAC